VKRATSNSGLLGRRAIARQNEIQNQLDIAREANRTAQKSADAAVATERAQFYVVVTEYS
jgi:hypothetical protein